MKEKTNRVFKKHLRFAVLASDVVLFSVKDGVLYVRLINVNRPPYFKNQPGLPGGLIHSNETAEESAKRHLAEKTKIPASKIYLEQLYTFSRVNRDPRGRVVAVAYLALVPWSKLSLTECGCECRPGIESWWQPVFNAKNLAYDHDEVLAAALKRLASRARYTTLMSKLMPAEFTLTELEKAYESVLKTDLDKRNFRKKILKLGILKNLNRKRIGGRARPAKLYKFASSDVSEIEVL